MRMTAADSLVGPSGANRLPVLDGWRGFSILFVLAGHLLPIGPSAWRLNITVAALGMVLFFILSGFLITRFLLQHEGIGDFLIRRVCRVVPLAWAYTAVSLTILAAPPGVFLAQFLFYANMPPTHLTSLTEHMWSLCVEMQFYAGIALLVFAGGRRALYLLPALCIAVTAYRVSQHAYLSIFTQERLDEILAGCILALAFENRVGMQLPALMRRMPLFVLLPLLVLSCPPASGWLNYFRPYLAALAVGATLYRDVPSLTPLLTSRPLRYVAATSYALYVFHPLLVASWLGEGSSVVKYLKRPLLFAALFLIAHLSTFYYERYWIAIGKRLTTRGRRHPVA
jgi:peptidoglycan/LPS O-acetylase OafA/YrhL